MTERPAWPGPPAGTQLVQCSKTTLAHSGVPACGQACGRVMVPARAHPGEPAEEVVHDDGRDERLAQARGQAHQRVGQQGALYDGHLPGRRRARVRGSQKQVLPSGHPSLLAHQMSHC